jgi:hypothetical protein
MPGFLHIRFVVGACILLQFFATCSADTCYKFHKRAPVKSVCGRISDAMGESPVAELTLVDERGAVLFTAKTDHSGRFTFEPVPKGDYTLRAAAPGYRTEERQLSVTRNGEKNCKQKIEIILGVGSCGGSTYVKGFDKKRDLFDTE